MVFRVLEIPDSVETVGRERMLLTVGSTLRLMGGVV